MSSTLNILASTLLSTPVLHQKHYPIKLTQRFQEVDSSKGLHKASLNSFHLSTFSIADSPKCALEPRFGVIRSIYLFPVTESPKCSLKPQPKPINRPTELPVITITSPRKRPLESSCEDEFISGEPEAKRIRYSELEKPHECLHCGRLFPDANKLQQHRRLHLSDNSLMSWLGQLPLDIS